MRVAWLGRLRRSFSSSTASLANGTTSTTGNTNGNIHRTKSVPLSQAFDTQAGSISLGGRTYREELYAGRRLDLSSASLSSGLRGLQGILRDEHILEKVRARREFIRPCVLRSKERSARRRERFDAMVRDTVKEIKDIYNRLKN